MKTKFLSLFLSLIMVLSCFAAALPAFADGEEAGSGEAVDYDALAVEAGYVARVGTPEKAYDEGNFTGYYKMFASVQKGYTAGAGKYPNAYDAAVAALQVADATAEDKTVYMLADIEISNVFKMNAGITVDGMGHYISGIYHQKIVEFNSTDATNVATIRNLTVWQRGQHGPIQVSTSGAQAKIENCYILGTGVTTAGVIMNQTNQVLTMTNTTIKIIDQANVTGLGMDTDTGVRIYFDNQTLVMENCVIDCSENFGATGCYFRNANPATINENTDHNSAVLTNCIVIGQSAAIDSKDCSVTINGGTFISTLGASKMANVTEPVFDEAGAPVWKKGTKDENGNWKEKVDAEGYVIDDNGNKVQATQDVKVLKGFAGTNSSASGVTLREYTAYESSVIEKGRGGNFTLNGTVKFQGGVAPLTFNKDDNGPNGEAPNGTTTSNVTSFTYEADKDTFTWSDEAETAKIAEGYVAYTFNDDGTKTYYKNLSPVDKDYVAADGNAMQDAAGKTIYLISDVTFLDSKDKASDLVIGGPGSTNTANKNAPGFVNQDVVINGMGYTINTRGYFCIQGGGKLSISNATITTTSAGRHMFQTNTKDANGVATLNLTNVDLVANCALNGGFIVARGIINLDDVTFNYTDTFGAEATHMIHQDGPTILTFANCRMDLTTMAPKAGFLQATAADAVINFTGNTNIAFAKYGVVNAGKAGSTINVEDYAVVRSADNTFVMQDENDVINVKDFATIISTGKNAIKLVGKNSVANIASGATVTGCREVLHANGEGSTINIAENATITMTEHESNATVVYLEGKNSSVVTAGNITAVAGKPAITTSGEGATITVKAGTINGTVNVGAKATITTFGGTIDAGAATTEAIIVAADATANIYECVVKGGTAPKTGDTYAENTTEKTYKELSAKVPVNGAISLRMNADSEGMRFTSTVSKEVNDYAASLIEAGVVEDYNYGTLIVRATERENAEFTISGFANAGIKYAAIIANEGAVVNSDGSITYSAAVTNFKMKNYGVTLVARAFIAYTLTDGSTLYIYSEEPAEDAGTNLANLAKEALGNVKMAMEEGYKNKVGSYYEKDPKGKWKAKNGTAYAPYSKAQQELLNLYIEEA